MHIFRPYGMILRLDVRSWKFLWRIMSAQLRVQLCTAYHPGWMDLAVR